MVAPPPPHPAALRPRPGPVFDSFQNRYYRDHHNLPSLEEAGGLRFACRAFGSAAQSCFAGRLCRDAAVGAFPDRALPIRVCSPRQAAPRFGTPCLPKPRTG
jgi:hypothetical protein